MTRISFALAGLFFAVGCSASTSAAQSPVANTPETAVTEPVVAPAAEAETPAAAPVKSPDWSTGASIPSIGTLNQTAPEAIAVLPGCKQGALKQGGLILCTGLPGSVIELDGEPVAKIDDTGRASIGLNTNAPKTVALSLPYQDAVYADRLSIAERVDEYREITGLDCDKVDARSQAQKDHAARAWVWKQNAFNEFHDGPGFWEGVTRPAEGPASSPFGPARKYIGVSKVTGEPCEKTSIHRGYDIATPIGTPLLAPADGVVTLAKELYYEGNAIFVDHGQGLVSVFMHLSEFDVTEGDVVKAGDVIGKTGNTGRTTGPHLHWSVKWRNTASDEREGDFYIDPSLLLDGLLEDKTSEN